MHRIGRRAAEGLAEDFQRDEDELHESVVDRVRQKQRPRTGRHLPLGEQTQKRFAQFFERLKPPFAVALQPLQDEPVEFDRRQRTLDPHRGRGFGNRFGERRRQALVLVRGLPGQEVVERRGDGVDVGIVADRFAADLLRRGEQDRAQKRPGVRELLIRGVRPEGLRQPEVADLHAVVFGQKAIRRLHIAVDHPESVRFDQPVDHVERPDDGLGHRQRAAVVDQIFQRPPRHQLHDDVRPAGVGIGSQHEDATRVGDLAGQPAFLPETFDRHRVRRQSA